MKQKVVLIKHAGLFFLSILFFNGYAQLDYFNKRYELTPYATWDFGKTILQQGNGYIVQGETFGEYGWRIIATMKVDSIGNLIWIKTIGDTISEHAAGYPGSLLAGTNGNYYSAGDRRTYTTNWVHDRGLLIKYDINFDTLWTKEYGEKSQPYDTSFIFWNINVTKDNGLIITGCTGSNGNNPSVYLLKTDSAGNNQWDKTFTNLGGDTQGYSVIQTTDGGYSIGAQQYYHVAPPNETGNPIVIKTDSLGNQQWVRILGGPYMEDITSVVANSGDGNIIILSAYSDSVVSQDEWAKRIRITKVSNNNTILFDKFYKKTIYGLYPLSISCNPDGSIVASGITGTVLAEYPHKAGWILKTDSNGDSLWFREYNMLHDIGSRNVLYNIIQTTDKGYVACGEVDPSLPNTGTQDVWILKVDSMGCESPSYCWVDIKEPGADGNAKLTGELLLYPNPASDIFRVSGFPIPPLKKSSLLISTILGSKVSEILLQNGQNSAAVDCSVWSPGMYILQLLQNGSIIAKGKIIVW